MSHLLLVALDDVSGTLSPGQLRALAARTESRREEERERVARGLQDGLGQYLAALSLDIAWLKRQAVRNDSGVDIVERLNAMGGVMERCFGAVQKLAAGLRPAVLNLGLVEAIEWQAETFEAESGLAVDFGSTAEVPTLDNAVATSLFRILQEMLANARRHEGARRVLVELELRDDLLMLAVSDDGTVPQEEDPAASLSIWEMREQTQRLGGVFLVGEGETGGPRVSVMVKLPGDGVLPR